MGRHCYVLLRLRRDVPIRRRGHVPLRRLGDVPPRRHWVFHLRRTCDVAGTHKDTSLRRRQDVLLPDGDSPHFCNLNFKFFNLESFWNSLSEIFLSARTVTSIMIHIFSSDFFIVLFGSFASMFLSVLIVKSHKMVNSVLSITDCCICSYYFSV